MKNIITILLSILGFTVSAETIYSRTQTMSIGDCLVYHTTFWGDNGTDNVNDDRYLGFHDVLDCSKGEYEVPEDLHTYWYYPDGPGGKVELRIPKDPKMITFAEYQKRLLGSQFELQQLPTEIKTNDIQLQQIKVIPLKNE